MTNPNAWNTNAMKVDPAIAGNPNKANENLEYLKHEVDNITFGLPTGYINGLLPSNSVGSPNTVIDFTAGKCRDDADSVDIVLSAGAVDFETNGLNGLDTGSIAADTWYYIYAVSKADGSDSGFLASTSATTPTMPTDYTAKLKRARIKTNASSQIDLSEMTRYEPDGTATFEYQQLAGNFPNTDITVSHNLNTDKILFEYWAKRNTTGKKFLITHGTIGTNDTVSGRYANWDDTELVIFEGRSVAGSNWQVQTSESTAVTVGNSSNYRFGCLIRSLN